MALDKEFSLTANYPKGSFFSFVYSCINYVFAKGKGDVFKLWKKKPHLGFPLWNVDHVNGSRQDIFVTGAKCDHWNRAACIEFLDYLLRCKEKDNKLEQILFLVLSSLEMTGLLRSVCIM